MIEVLSNYPLLLLFVVASMGYLIGTIKVKGVSLGVSAVLFTGLFFGALDPGLKIPEIIFQLGLSIFIYSIGLTSGPAFFASYKKNGGRDIIFILVMLIFSGLMAAAIFYIMGFSPATITGIYTGGTTNTAALAGVLDYINHAFPAAEAARMTNEAVVGYSLSYPMGVMSGILGILAMEKWLGISYRKEEEALGPAYQVNQPLVNRAVRIESDKVIGQQLRDVVRMHDCDVVFGRIFRGEEIQLVNWDTIFRRDDIVIIVGVKTAVDNVTKMLGSETDLPEKFDRSLYDNRRIFLSNPNLAGRTISSLNLHEKYNTVISRIRRGDTDMLASSDTVLELGDRIRFTARRKDLKAISDYFGDSYQESSKLNLFSFGLGIGLGLVLGQVEFSLGGGVAFKLGYAGGPLLVGLILGSLRRTGRILWTLPYSVNVTLQQMGLIFLLTAVGVSSGDAFISSLSYEGFWIFLAGFVISMMSAFTLLWVGFKWLKLPFSILTGFVSNQPAILEVATSRSGNKLPVFGFTMMMPLALISKILIAQLLFLVLMG